MTNRSHGLLHLCCVIAVLGIIGAHSAIASQPLPVTQSAYLVWFKEQEAGIGSYRVRMIVSDRYLRIDDGDDLGDFVLFDRRRAAIHSVDHGQQSVLVVTKTAFDLDAPPVFQLRTEQVDTVDAPTVVGTTVNLYRLYTNERLCFEIAAAKGLLDEVVEALREFHRTLAGDQALAAGRAPLAMRSDCDLSETVFEPDRYLQFGFPIRQSDYNGRHRELQSYDAEYLVDPRLFEVPQRYRRVKMSDLLG